MADFTSWDDVRRYLDDPNVSEDEKRRILRTYANGNATPWYGIGDLPVNADYWEHRDEILAYAEQYGVEDYVEDNEEFKSEEDLERGQRQLADATARADADIARAQAEC